MGKPLDDVLAERKRQDGKWGEQNHAPEIWLAILGEEVGEASREVLEYKFASEVSQFDEHFKKYRKEMVQVAAVALAAIESFDRNFAKGQLKK